MKRTLLILALIVCSAANLHSMKPVDDKQKKQFSALWSQYHELVKADKPAQSAAKLMEIRNLAQELNSPYDFYFSGLNYVTAVSSRNWKEKEGAKQDFADAVKAFDCPIVTYRWMLTYGDTREAAVKDFLEKNAGRLLEGKNSRLWGTVNSMNGVLAKHIANDMEYILWDQYLRSGRFFSVLDAAITEDYPKRAYLGYCKAMRFPDSSRGEFLTRVVDAYPGTAVSYIASQELLRLEYGNLSKSKDRSSEDYKAYYQKCKDFTRAVKRLSGDEATIAEGLDYASDMCKKLTAKALEVRAGGDSIAVDFQNLDEAAATMYCCVDGNKGQKVASWRVKNPARSFYLTDVSTIPIPEKLDDGEYVIEAVNGKLSSTTYYNRHTVSLAWRKDDDGYKVYAASWRSGESIPVADVQLCKGSTVLHSKHLVLDGFTPLPEKWNSIIEEGDTHYSLSCSYKDKSGITRNSDRVGISRTWLYGSSYRNYVSKGCRIFKDRGAYNPGDVLKFKAIVFEGNYVDRMSVLPGKQLTAVLYDTESKEIERKEFTSNEFGSIAGEFTLPKGRRNGHFSLVIMMGDSRLASDSFRVDEFVLPTFELVFEPQDSLYMPGDVVKVKGKVSSYSGHTLTGATIAYRVTCWNKVIYDKNTTPEEDGSFVLSFPAGESGVYHIEASVTDATGETQAFSTILYISSSIHVCVGPVSQDDGSFTLTWDRDYDYGIRDRYATPPSRTILRGKKGTFELYVTDSDGDRVPGKIDYKLVKEDESVILEGSASSGDMVELDFSSLPDALYYLRASSEIPGRKVKDDNYCIILKQEGGIIDAPVRRLFVPGETEVAPGEDISVFFGSADGPTWAVVTLFGDNNQVLETSLLTLSGERGREGNTSLIAFPYKDSYPDAVRISIFYFKYGRDIHWSEEFTRRRTILDLPLSFSTFVDEATPGKACTVTLDTAPGAEVLAAVYDKSIDAVAPNEWKKVSLRQYSAAYTHVNSTTGGITGVDPLTGKTSLVNSGSRYYESGGELPLLAEAAPLGAPMPEENGGADEEITVRKSFDTSLCFEPMLRPGEDGKLSFTFKTSDKLSTFYVHVYAHDKDMRNAVTRREMKVTMPVKVSLVQPGFLYEGDVLKPSVSVSNSSGEPVSGTLKLYVYPGEDYNGKPTSVKTVKLTVPARGVKASLFEVPATGECLGLKAVFSAGMLSDAMFVTVPVYDKVQTLTESHSAVLLPGANEKQLLQGLRKQFVNAKGSSAEYSEISIIDMVREALPAKKKPSGSDVLSLSEAYYVRLLSAELEGEETDESELLERIMACRNSDGGFGWFQGMSSSMMITTVIMERFARLARAGFDVPDLSSSAQFLDNKHFAKRLPYWCGWISDQQYMYARSLYPEVPFKVDGSKLLTQFKADAAAYLVPSKADGRGLNGRILNKARRLRTLQNLCASPEGVALAKAWGVGGKSAMRTSLEADVESLLDYAVKHPDGGFYYPNAVMPWRGLLETEAYAHSLICDLMSSVGAVAPDASPTTYEVADGIRIWLMLQKETQKWGEDPAYVDALNSIMHGSEEVLSTKVMVLKATYTKPFVQIKAAGNGFTIERRFYKAVAQYDEYEPGDQKFFDALEEVRPGDIVPVGTKIIARYVIWNQENRSFVRLSATREASLRPVDQLSGHYGWRLRPFSIDGYYGFAPQGYRDVKTDRTEYWFDSYPEENTVITEELFVTQAGTFSAPVVSIESLYAPHYRANDGFKAPLKASWDNNDKQ